MDERDDGRSARFHRRSSKPATTTSVSPSSDRVLSTDAWSSSGPALLSSFEWYEERRLALTEVRSCGTESTSGWDTKREPPKEIVISATQVDVFSERQLVAVLPLAYHPTGRRPLPVNISTGHRRT